jgi:hypothetical protein
LGLRWLKLAEKANAPGRPLGNAIKESAAIAPALAKAGQGISL